MIINNFAISKKEYSDFFIYKYNCGDSLSMSSGCINIKMSLYNNVKDGIYQNCHSNKYFSDYLIFSVNNSELYIDYPGIYAAFSSDGIVFTIFSKSGRYAIIDKTSNINSNEIFDISFCWDYSASLGSGATMAIFINNQCTSSGNFRIYNSNIFYNNLYLFDNKNLMFNGEYNIYNFNIYNALPVDKINKVENIIYDNFGDNQIILSGSTFSLKVVDDNFDNMIKINDLKSLSFYNNTLDICDISGNIFFASLFNDGYQSCSVSKYNSYKSVLDKTVKFLTYPVSVSVIQKDSYNYLKNYYYNDENDGVWVSDRTRLFLFDNNLELISKNENFLYINEICSLLDKGCLVSDYNSNKIFVVSNSGVITSSINIKKPKCLCSNIKNEIYCYSVDKNVLYQIIDFKIKRLINIDYEVALLISDIRGGAIYSYSTSGYLYKYNSKLELKLKKNIGLNIKAIMLRKGYGQNSILAINNISNKITFRSSNDFSFINEISLDPDFIFSGGICCSSNNLANINCVGEMNFQYNSGNIIIKDVDIACPKVIQYSVDLSGGGSNANFNNLNKINETQSTTDEQIIETYRLNNEY